MATKKKPVSEFKLLKDKTLLKSRVFEVHAEEWRAPDKTTFSRHTITHPGAVAILALDADGDVLMLRQFRPAARGWMLEIPAGTLEKGEAPLACAKRELIEETGFAAKKWKKLGEIFTAPGFCTELIHLYKAWDLKPAHAEKDEDEHIELATMTIGEVRAAIKAGKIRDAKTLSAVLCAELPEGE